MIGFLDFYTINFNREDLLFQETLFLAA